MGVFNFSRYTTVSSPIKELSLFFQVESYGIGLQLDIRSASAEDMLRALRTVIENPAYAENMKKASAMLRSSRRSGREKAADAIEHVLTYGGKHLRSTAARNENFLQHLGLDVWIAYLLLVHIVVALCLNCHRFITCFICRLHRGRLAKKKRD